MLKVTGMANPIIEVPSASGMMRIVNREAMAWAPSMVRAAMGRAHGKVPKRIAASGKARKVNYGVSITFGGGNLRPGVPLRDVTRQYEFGSNNQETPTTYLSRSPRGKAYRVTRRTRRQLPPFEKEGRFLYPAVADATPALTSRLIRAILAEVVPDAR